jgi:hypothetical protein
LRRSSYALFICSSHLTFAGRCRRQHSSIRAFDGQIVRVSPRNYSGYPACSGRGGIPSAQGFSAFAHEYAASSP